MSLCSLSFFFLLALGTRADELGYPIVDAAMRSLNSTAYMHNRLRMITASFLAKHLLLDWRLGEQYFITHLIDGDFASNNGGWGFLHGRRSAALLSGFQSLAAEREV